MKEYESGIALERKFCKSDTLPLALKDGAVIEGYASVFGAADYGGDIVQSGAYTACLRQMGTEGRRVKMLWQHDPCEPIGVWDEVREDARGLYVKGRILTDVARGREAVALVAAGAIDGLSIGYRTKRAGKDDSGHRLLAELELWEVSLVTFPMLADARVGTKAEGTAEELLRDLAEAFAGARRMLAEG